MLTMDAHPLEGQESNVPIFGDADSELLWKYHHGDEAAFTQLVEQYHAFACRLAARVLHNATTAEDVVQGCWLKVAQHAPFDFERRFKPWFGRIIVNACLDYMRREKQSPNVVEFSQFEKNGQKFRPFADSYTDPLDQLADASEVTNVLSRIGEKYAQVLWEIEAMGADVKEYASEIDVSYSTICWRLSRARKMFRERFAHRIVG